MRKLFFIIALLFCANLVFAQKGKVTSAVSFFTQGKIEKAKELIDQAIVHESCEGWPKAYFVKGQIYQAIYESPNQDVKKLAADPLNTAWEAFQEVIKLDDKDKFKKDLQAQFANLSIDFQNQGYENYSKNDFKSALEDYKKVLLINENKYGTQKVDTAVIYNTGIIAQRAGDLDQALGYFKKSLKLNYQPNTLYPMIAGILMTKSEAAFSSGDSVLGNKIQLEAVDYLEKGYELFPKESYMLISLINYYIKGATPEKAEKYLDAAIELTPDDAELYRTKGELYDRLEQPEKAAAMYLKTLELNPNDFRAQYNLGNIHLNRVIAEHEKFDKQTDDLDAKAYNAAYGRILDLYESVIPYFEKALEIDPTDKYALSTLQQLYFRLRDKPNTDYQQKYDKVKETLDHL